MFYLENFPRPIPLELFDDETLKRLDLLDEKKEEESVKETSKLRLVSLALQYAIILLKIKLF